MKHYLCNYLTAPNGPVDVGLVGCGGTGSQIAFSLARMNTALKALDHPGLHLTIFDPDHVSEANIGRQLFSPVDVGFNKATVLASRINQFFGCDWRAMPTTFPDGDTVPSLLITAVDTVSARNEIDDFLSQVMMNSDPDCNGIYWLDTGNTRNTGQVVLGTAGSVEQPTETDTIEYLPAVTQLYDFSEVDEAEQGPSCSLAAALESQDLMINQMVSTCAMEILWQGFRQGYVTNHGAFIDIRAMKVSPLPVNPKVWKRMKN